MFNFLTLNESLHPACIMEPDDMGINLADLEPVQFTFRYARHFWHTFLLFICISVCSAQKQVRIERITVDQGLSQSSISAITQDKYGYLWVATLDGLNRYDGRQFKIYKHSNDPKSLYRDHVVQLHLDNRQTLWVAHEGVIARYNPQQDNFDSFPLPPYGDLANTMVHDLDNISDSIALLSTNHGIVQFNTKTGSIKTPKEYSGFNGENIINYFTESNGNIWLAAHHAVYLKKKNSSTWTTMFTDKTGLRVYYHQPSGKIYLQTQKALYKFAETNSQFEVIDQFDPNEDFDANKFGMIKLSNGELWLFRKVIHVYNPNDQRIASLSNIPQNPTSLSGNYLTCIFESNDNVVWIGTNGFGLNKYDPVLSIFKYIGSFDGTPITLSNNFVYSVFTDDDNIIYVSTFSGLDVLNLKQNRSEHYPLVSKNGLHARAQKIFKDSQGTIWLCTDKGLMRLHDKKVRLSGITMLDTVDVYDVVATSPDNYFLTTDKGLYSFSPARRASARIAMSGSIPLGYMDGTLWTESLTDIKCIDPSNGKVVRTISKKGDNSRSFRNFPIKCFYQDGQSRRWIGSWGGGLSLLTPQNEFEFFSEKDGLPNSVVYGILEDNHNNLWLSTNKGISVFKKEQKKSVRNFYKADGLQGDEFNTKAFHKSPNGKLYFGGTNGLTFFDPEEAMRIQIGVPKTILVDFFVNNTRIERFQDGKVYQPETNNKIILQNNERNFTFEIAGLGFSSPGRTQYKYILENFNTDWSLIGNQRIISFTNIPPGNYTFRAKSANSFGEWEAEGLVVNIVVNGPFYNAAWFRWGMLGLFALTIYLYYRQRTASLRARAHYLEELVKERTRKIQNMNEEIAAQNEELASQSESLIIHNDELTLIKASLEQMVDERTVELQKLNSELVKQNSQLEQFAFITAHNLRGPVARIKGLLQLFPKVKTDEVTHLESCVNDLDEVILDLSTILDVRHGTDKIFEPVQLKSVLNQAIKTIDDELSKKKAVIDDSQLEDVSLIGIQSYFVSIFHNLLHNAIKYADTNRPLKIIARAKRDEHATYIEIEDNGIGIDLRYAEGKIFNLYQRFHPSVKGKGFGLFLVRTQVEAMNGSIEVKSEVSKGTTFKIIIPNS
jgi:signal transduction histidine kinase/ligand-binding sensor domain-containing protein